MTCTSTSNEPSSVARCADEHGGGLPKAVQQTKTHHLPQYPIIRIGNLKSTEKYFSLGVGGVPVVEGMSPEGQQPAIVHITGFLKATASYYATMKRLGLDDGPQAA